jgi:hypothetical protein
MTRRLALVSCCGEKLGRVAPARQLYRSQLFRKSVAWVTAQGLDWWVISSSYGLIHPDSQLAPYDSTVRGMTPEDRAAWNLRIAREIDVHFENDQVEIVLLAGASYAGWIPLVQPWCRVEQPLQGLQIGQRLQWLTAALS